MFTGDREWRDCERGLFSGGLLFENSIHIESLYPNDVGLSIRVFSDEKEGRICWKTAYGYMMRNWVLHQQPI